MFGSWYQCFLPIAAIKLICDLFCSSRVRWCVQVGFTLWHSNFPPPKRLILEYIPYPGLFFIVDYLEKELTVDLLSFTRDISWQLIYCHLPGTWADSWFIVIHQGHELTVDILSFTTDEPSLLLLTWNKGWQLIYCHLPGTWADSWLIVIHQGHELTVDILSFTRDMSWQLIYCHYQGHELTIDLLSFTRDMSWQLVYVYCHLPGTWADSWYIVIYHWWA